MTRSGDCETYATALLATEPAYAADDDQMYHLAKYFSKNPVELNECLGVVLASRRRALKQCSVADDAGTAARDGKFLLTKVVNATATMEEISPEQAAANLMGLDSL